MTPEHKSAILQAKRLYNETWKLILSLEAEGLPPAHEVFDILAIKLEERMDRYHALLDAELANRAKTIISEICKN